MPLFHRAVIAPIIALILIFPSFAFADDDEKYDEMLDLSDAANEFVMDGHFDLGAVKLRHAYQAFPDPILLRNEMLAWYRAGDCKSALAPARAFLQTDDVEPQDRVDVETVQRECHLQLAEDAVEQESPLLATFHLDSVSDLVHDNDSESTYLELRRQVDQMPRPASQQNLDSPAPVETTSHGRDFGWIQIAAGIATVGTSAALHTVALDRQAQLNQLSNSAAPSDAISLQRRQEDWGGYQNTTRWLVPTLYGVGGAAIGSGIYFLFRDSSSTDSSIALTPQLSPQRVGIDFSARF